MGVFDFLFVTIVLCVLSASADVSDKGSAQQPTYGPAFDEIVVESSLNIRQKSASAQSRRVRDVLPLAEYIREKRSPRRRGPTFTGSASSGQTQGFQGGGFGASSSNSITHGFSGGPGGLHATGGFAASQTYNLPHGQTINVALSNAGGSGVTYSG